MTLRKIVSLSVLLSFLVLLVTGILEYFQSHTRLVSTMHTLFGLVFTLGVVLHFYNNFKSTKFYFKTKLPIFIGLSILGLLAMTYYDMGPASALADYGTKLRAGQKQDVAQSLYEVIEVNTENGIQLSIDLKRDEHYWHPQMAIWTEEMNGDYIETIYVSKATAQGLFFGGRSKDNFKTFDTEKDALGNDYRRVNALPVWSHKRGVQYPDGMYVPPNSNPLPDGITGATLSDNFLMHTSTKATGQFKVRVEINVAFDDNEYYSEYDFPDDEEFHAGTGQLGQPSIIYETIVDMEDGRDYYLMDLVGHGHHSGQDGKLNRDLSTLTTALEIVERLVLGVERL